MGKKLRGTCSAAMTDIELNSAQIAGRARRAEERAIRRARHRRMLEVRQMLIERYPKCFQAFGMPKLPFALGIRKALLGAVPDIDPHDLINALDDYVSGKTYLAAQVAGAARVDLDGRAVGVVTAHGDAYAKHMLARLAAPPKERTRSPWCGPKALSVAPPIIVHQTGRAARLLQQTTRRPFVSIT
jgi:ProQ/FINO family